MSNLSLSEVAISLPFTIEASGSVSSTTNTNKIWMDRVASVIGTLVGERIMRPNFGSKLSSAVFANMGTVSETIENEISSVFASFLPKLQLINTEVSFNEADGVASATITFITPSQDNVTTTVGLAAISGNKLISEESL